MFNLTDVKKEIKAVKKKGGHIRKIAICGEEFGEGYNVYIDVTYWFEDDAHIISYTLSEEEKKGKALAKINRLKESLEKIAETNLEKPHALITEDGELVSI